MGVLEHQQSAITWAKEYLTSKGHTIRGETETIREVPWSCVHRIATSIGIYYLKIIALPFAIETKLLPYLTRFYPASLPHIMATNEDFHAMIMTDAGVPLRDILQKKYQVNFINSAIEAYSSIQIGMISHVDQLLSLGVPDWRLSALPSLYLQLLSEEATLKDDGLTHIEITKLRTLKPKIAELCRQLSEFQIPETIEHGDFHDNNILIGTDEQLVISDWGDAVISHPFFSLTSCLSSAKRNHMISESSPPYITIRDSYLNNWVKFEPKNRLLKALQIAERLSNIKFAISFYRVTLCCEANEREAWKGFISEALTEFLRAEYR